MRERTVIPNVFIAGAPKCGTTSLSAYLSTHPAVALSIPKEPFYFASDLPGIRVVDRFEAYLRMFTHAGPHTRCFIDASPLYLYSTTAAREIHAFNPAARIIVMLRNPVDLAASFHAQCVFSHLEDRREFTEAWELQEPRRRGEQLPRGCRAPRLLQYRDVAALGTQLERLLAVFPLEQVLVLLLDELVEDPLATYLRVLAFLDLPDDGRRDFPVLNPRKAPRVRVPPGLVGLYLGLRRRFGARPQFQRAVGLAKALGSRPVDPQPLAPAFRHRLTAELGAERERLRELTGQDLSRWD